MNFGTLERAAKDTNSGKAGRRVRVNFPDFGLRVCRKKKTIRSQLNNLSQTFIGWFSEYKKPQAREKSA
jgi:hypothetical protein